MAFLIVEGGETAGQKVDLVGSLVVGRQVRDGLSIKDLKASREHTRFELTSAGWVVIDLESTNGTQLNGRKVTREFINTGDRITVGQTVFRFENPNAQPMTTTQGMKDSRTVPGVATGPMSAPLPDVMGSVVSAPAPGGRPPAGHTPTPRTYAAPPQPATGTAGGVAPVEKPVLRYQNVGSGPGPITWLLCIAVIIGLVFAARMIGKRAMAKVMDERKVEQAK